MNDIVIQVKKETATAYKNNEKLGNKTQNLQNKLKFEFVDEIVEGSAWLEYEIDGVKKYTPMEKYDKGYQVDIKNNLLTSNQVSVDLKITQDETYEGVPIFVTNIVTFSVENTINADEKEIEEYEAISFEINSEGLLEMTYLDTEKTIDFQINNKGELEVIF